MIEKLTERSILRLSGIQPYQKPRKKKFVNNSRSILHVTSPLLLPKSLLQNYSEFLHKHLHNHRSEGQAMTCKYVKGTSLQEAFFHISFMSNFVVAVCFRNIFILTANITTIVVLEFMTLKNEIEVLHSKIYFSYS